MVIDASVLTDMFISERKRHDAAKKLAKHIKNQNIRVILPMHAIIEIKSAIEQERKQSSSTNLALDTFPEENPLEFKMVPIDDNFIADYFDKSIPHLRAGDLIYVLVAKKYSCPLITEDKAQYKVAKRIGLETYKIVEYLNTLNRAGT